MATSSPAESPAMSLSFTSWNDDKPTSIVLLHGGFTCRLEFALVLPHLSDFHLLVPDQPLHSASRHIEPGTIDNAARHVAQLIRSHAHGEKAHVVGVSMGGFVGQRLALDQPGLVLSLFVTGAAPLASASLYMMRWTRMIYYSTMLTIYWPPAWAYQYLASSLLGLKLSDELVAEMKVNVTWQLIQDMTSSVSLFTLDHVRQLQVRTLSIAGAKRDDVGMHEKVGEALRSRRTSQDEPWPEDGSGAIAISEATHGWDMQFPELFARGISAWVRREELPTEFKWL